MNILNNFIYIPFYFIYEFLSLYFIINIYENKRLNLSFIFSLTLNIIHFIFFLLFIIYNFYLNNYKKFVLILEVYLLFNLIFIILFCISRILNINNTILYLNISFSSLIIIYTLINIVLYFKKEQNMEIFDEITNEILNIDNNQIIENNNNQIIENNNYSSINV